MVEQKINSEVQIKVLNNISYISNLFNLVNISYSNLISVILAL